MGLTSVQLGQRTQNATPGRTGRHRKQHRMTLAAEGSGLQTAPMSAARLAAEAAFTAPPFNPAPSIQAQITVRKARLVVGAAPTGMPTAAASSCGEQASQAPRVFRVDASRVASQPQVSAILPAVRTSSAVTPIGVTKQSARRATDKRPGPVVHVINALPVHRREIEVAQPTQAALIVELARVGPVLEEIKRAQSLVFIDEHCSKEWQRLSGRADELRRELQAQLR